MTSPYPRFIPREKLGAFAAWAPGAFGVAADAPRDDAPADNAELDARLQAARHAGYQDGYRDGMAALDSFKHSFATQMAARIGQLIEGFDVELLALEQRIAQTVAETAVELARQVVRGELTAQPKLVAQVAREALSALLASARQITLWVHPDDEPLVADGAGEALAARDARLVADATVQRGGCRVESDIGGVDATLAARWQRACAAFGTPRSLDDDAADTQP